MYLGPDSAKPYAGNRISCSNCHREGGTKPFAIPLYVATKEYAPPGIYSPREGLNRTIEIRINGCFERSLAGRALPVDSYEMRSMVAYLEWLSTGIAPGLTWKDVKGQETPSFRYWTGPRTRCAGKRFSGTGAPNATALTARAKEGTPGTSFRLYGVPTVIIPARE